MKCCFRQILCTYLVFLICINQTIVFDLSRCEAPWLGGRRQFLCLISAKLGRMLQQELLLLSEGLLLISLLFLADLPKVSILVKKYSKQSGKKVVARFFFKGYALLWRVLWWSSTDGRVFIRLYEEVFGGVTSSHSLEPCSEEVLKRLTQNFSPNFKVWMFISLF